jgi:hypothetical protein
VQNVKRLPRNGLQRNTGRLSLPLAVLAATLLYAGGATATASTGVEGVWSFNGGQIAVQHLSNGTYAGTVVAETKFAACTHPVGQKIWTGMTEQHDGSYWGLHQWYLANCKENPERGPTAWRVLQEPSGARYMRVCFSRPGTSQPTIAANRAPKEESEYHAHGVTFGCYDSALIAPLPLAPGRVGASRRSGAIERLSPPGTRKCLSVRLFKIRLRNPPYDPFKKVTITLNGHKIATSHSGNYVIATINLARMHSNMFTIKIHATTVLGHSLSAHRTYHRCAKKAKPRKRRKKG